jgi:hypothetical protein
MMSKSKNKSTWKTKYGLRRVRQEQATLADAIAAAQDLSDDRDQQIEIASSLIGLPQEEVRAALLSLAPARKRIVSPVTATPVVSGQRVVVVESKRPRRVMPDTHRRSAFGN